MSRPPRFSKLSLMAAIAVTGPAHAADSACKPIIDAMAKYMHTPSHMYSESTQGSQVKPQVSESINTGTQRFVLAPHGWLINPMSTQDLMDALHDNSRNAQCRYQGDDMVLGDAVAVYSMIVTNDYGKTDGRYWISKRSGLPVKHEQTINAGTNPRTARHLSERISYDAVQAPVIRH